MNIMITNYFNNLVILIIYLELYLYKNNILKLLKKCKGFYVILNK